METIIPMILGAISGLLFGNSLGVDHPVVATLDIIGGSALMFFAVLLVYHPITF